jgi:hypothetical protein
MAKRIGSMDRLRTGASYRDLTVTPQTCARILASSREGDWKLDQDRKAKASVQKLLGCCMRQFFSGVYGFRLQGFLRAPSYDKGEYLGVGNPLLQQPIVIAGFFPRHGYSRPIDPRASSTPQTDPRGDPRCGLMVSPSSLPESCASK